MPNSTQPRDATKSTLLQQLRATDETQAWSTGRGEFREELRSRGRSHCCPFPGRPESRPIWVRNIVQMHLNDIALRIENLSIQYAEVYEINRSADWALLKLTEEVGELAQAHLTATGQSKDRGISADEQRQVVADELGDILGMYLVYAKQLGIDPEVAIAEKWFRHEAAPATSAE